MTDCGQVLWYKMDEPSGAIAADSVDSRDADIKHGVTLGATAPPQGNGSFDYQPSTTKGWLYRAANGDPIDITPSTGAHSIAVWVEAKSGISINAVLFRKGGTSTPPVHIQKINNDLRYYPTASTAHYCTWTSGISSILNDGQMHLVVGTWDPFASGTSWGKAVMYVDGSAINTRTPATDIKPLSDWTNGDIYIGAGPGTSGAFDGTVNWWKGRMGDFQVFDYALSADEVALMFTTGEPCAEPPPPEPSGCPWREDVLANGPILYFEFEETSGTVAADSSGNGLDGVVDTTDDLVTFSETGEHDLAYGFHPVGGIGGSIGPVVVPNTAPWPDLSALPKITIEAWVKQTGTSGNQRICEIGTSGISGEVFVIITSTTVWFGLMLSGGYQDMTWTHAGEPSDGEFHLLQCDYDGTDMHIYWDGALKASETHSGQTVNYSDAAAKLTIGWKGHGGSPGDSDTFDGIIDDFAIYPIAVADKVEADCAPLVIRDSVYYEELGYVTA